MKRSIGLLLFVAGLSHAGTILLQSGVSSGESNNVTTNNVVLSNLEPDWAPDQDGASWISYENTGYSASSPTYAVNTLPNATSESSPNAEFFQTFTDTFSPLTLTITVWADDSAVLFLDGMQESPNVDFTQTTGIACTPSGITCTGPGTTFTFTDLAAGTHTIQLNVYQLGGGTYGVMYEGTVTDSSSAPEPGSYITLGSGLAALGLLRLKRAI